MKCSKKQLSKTSYCIGDFVHKIDLTKRSDKEFTDDIGEVDYDFTLIRSIWVGLKTTSGTIWRDGIATNDGASHIFIMRYSKDIKNELFIEYKGTRYEIIDTKNVDEMSEWLELRCKKIGLVELKGSKA